MLATLPVSILVLRRYRGAVESAMRQSAPGVGHPDSGTLPERRPQPADKARIVRLEVLDGTALSELTGAAAALERRSTSALRLTGLAYAIAGIVFALAATLAVFHLGDIDISPRRLLLVIPVFAWLIFPALAMVTGAHARFWTAGVILYVLAWGLGLMSGSDLNPLWFVHAVLPTALAVLIGNRWLRPVAPLLLLLFLLLATGLPVGGISLLFAVGGERGAPDLTAGISAAVALCVLAVALPFVLASLYRRKLLSDQMLIIDIWWMLYCLWIAMVLSAGIGISGVVVVLLFPAFAVTLALAFRATGRSKAGTANRPLLILRVFGFRRRSEQLLRELQVRWRPVGNVELIAGTDLATENLEPHELVSFFTGRLARSFVRNEEDLAARLESEDRLPDPDGRFRVNEYFCFENTWRPAVRALADRASVALMDLRGFSATNAGCTYELNLLISSVPLSRIVLLMDATTDRAYLQDILDEGWSLVSDDPPDSGAGERTVRALDVDKLGTNMPRVTMRMLCAAASS